jgi:hypothetical protein
MGPLAALEAAIDKQQRLALIMVAAIAQTSMTTALLLALAVSLILMTLIVQRLNKASN